MIKNSISYVGINKNICTSDKSTETDEEITFVFLHLFFMGFHEKEMKQYGKELEL